MSDVTIITAPDKLYSQEFSFLLIYPDSIVKEQFQNLIAEYDMPVHVYMYEDDTDIHWLLDVFQQVNVTIIDIDNLPGKLRDIIGYFLTKDKSFWLTNSGENYYNTISRNRIFNLDFLKQLIGGSLG